MNLRSLSTFDLYNHFINMNRAFLNATRDPSSYFDADEIKSVKEQVKEVVTELERRRKIAAQQFYTYSFLKSSTLS